MLVVSLKVLHRPLELRLQAHTVQFKSFRTEANKVETYTFS